MIEMQEKKLTIQTDEGAGVLGVRVNPELKREAEEIFAQRGSTLSQEIRRFLRRTVHRSQSQKYCRKHQVGKVMGAIQLGDTRRLEVVRKTTSVDC